MVHGGGNLEVKLARIRKGLTQAQLCKMVKMSPKKLVEIEKGNYDKLNVSLAKKISIVLEKSVQELFFSDDDTKK